MSFSQLEEKLNLDAFNELHMAFTEADAGKVYFINMNNFIYNNY